MSNSFTNMRSRIWLFFKLHPISCALFFFLFIAGIAAGLQITLDLSDAANIPADMREYGVPFLYCSLISACVCAFIVSMLILAGLWLPASILWPASILIRGAVTGVAFRFALSLLPHAAAYWLITLLSLETAFMIPPFIKIASISGGLFALKIKRLTGVQLAEPCFSLYICPCAALLPLIALQSIATPVVMYLFC